MIPPVLDGWFFDLVCPGNAVSVSHKGLLLLKNATVNRNLGFNDVCKEKYAYIAYNNEHPTFVISNVTGEMLEPPVQPYLKYWAISMEWELQSAFFASYNVKPTWFNANGTWGTLNYTTGQWSGAVGMIQKDEVDYALWGFAGTYDRSTAAAFCPGIDFNPLHWLTRYPKELSPTWNLLGLFTKGHISQISFLNKIT